jgi:hypothetical protein
MSRECIFSSRRAGKMGRLTNQERVIYAELVRDIPDDSSLRKTQTGGKRAVVKEIEELTALLRDDDALQVVGLNCERT